MKIMMHYILLVMIQGLLLSHAVNITKDFYSSKSKTLRENHFSLSINQSFLTQKKQNNLTIQLPKKARYVFMYLTSHLEIIPNQKLSCGVLRIGIVKWFEVDGTPYFKKGFLYYSFAMNQNVQSRQIIKVNSRDTFLIYYYNSGSCVQNVSAYLTFNASSLYTSPAEDDASPAEDEQNLKSKAYLVITVLLAVCVVAAIGVVLFICLCIKKKKRKFYRRTSDEELFMNDLLELPFLMQPRIGSLSPNFKNWGPIEGINRSGKWTFKQCDYEDDKWSDIINKRDIGMRSRLLLLPEEFSGLTIVVELKGMSRNNLSDQFRIRFSAVCGIPENEEIILPVRLSVRVIIKLEDGRYRVSDKHELEITELWGYAEPDNFFLSFRETKTKELPEITFQFFPIEIFEERESLIKVTESEVFPTEKQNFVYNLEQQPRIGSTAPNFENWGLVEGLNDNGKWTFHKRDCESNNWSDIIKKRDIGMRSRLLLLPEEFYGLTVVVELKGMSRNNQRDQFRIRFSAVNGIPENEEISLPVKFSVRVGIKLENGRYRVSDKHDFEITELWGYAEPDNFLVSFSGTNTEQLPEIYFQFFLVV